MQKFFAVFFDAAYNIFLCVDKKDRRSHPKCRGPAGLFGVSTAVCAEHFSMFLYVICPFFVREKVGYTGSKGQSRRSFLHENLHKIYRRGESVTEGKFGNCIVLLSIGATIEGVDQIEIRSLTSI